MESSLVAGDTFSLTEVVPDYPAGDGWTYKLRLTPREVGGTAVTLTAAPSGDDYLISATATTTAAWSPGVYAWAGYVEKGDERHTVSTGTVTVEPDAANLVPGTDTRSQAEKAVADLKAAYATFVGSQGHIAEYEIAGRRMKFASGADIVQKLSFWQGELSSERAAKAVAAGLPDPRRIYLRVGRA